MKEQFFIQSKAGFDSAVCTLALLVGNDYFSYSISDFENNIIEVKRFYLQNTTTAQLNEILSLNEVLTQPFANIITAFDFNTNTLLPVDLNTGDNTPLLHLNGAGQQDHIIHEVVKDWDLANVYSIPYNLLNWVLTNFPSSKFWHVQSVYLKNTKKSAEAGCMNVDVCDKDFNVTVALQDKLLLAQRYSYSSPADVLFYLLKITESFGLSPEELQLKVSGLIDKDSALYKMLYDYFLNVELNPASWKFDEYPAHYFTLLNQLSLCES